jgi:hypothetical protein
MEADEKCQNCGHRESEHESAPPAPSGHPVGDAYEYPGSCKVVDCLCPLFRGK